MNASLFYGLSSFELELDLSTYLWEAFEMWDFKMERSRSVNPVKRARGIQVDIITVRNSRAIFTFTK